MANGSSRLVPALVSLVIGFALGWMLHNPDLGPDYATKPPHKKPVGAVTGDHLIGVHGDGSLTLPEAHISKSANKNQGNHVAWVADRDQGLVIAFPEKGFPNGVKEPPFEGMKSRPGADPKDMEWVVRCGADTCYSGNINQKVPDGAKYKYDQIVAGKRTDGMVIIEK